MTTREKPTEQQIKSTPPTHTKKKPRKTDSVKCGGRRGGGTKALRDQEGNTRERNWPGGLELWPDQRLDTRYGVAAARPRMSTDLLLLDCSVFSRENGN